MKENSIIVTFLCLGMYVADEFKEEKKFFLYNFKPLSLI